jgi:hypothetical protein
MEVEERPNLACAKLWRKLGIHLFSAPLSSKLYRIVFNAKTLAKTPAHAYISLGYTD